MDVLAFCYNSTSSETSRMSPKELTASSPSIVAQPLPKAQPPTPLFTAIHTAYTYTCELP